MKIGDSERQAHLRDQLIKKRRTAKRDTYVSCILSTIKPQMKILDVGCGTAHIIRELADARSSSFFVGLDVSSAMLKRAGVNNVGLSNLTLVEGDGCTLPFDNGSLDIIITRLAEYSVHEAFRALRRGGYFFEYGLGPDADREIKEFFPERIELESFFFPKNPARWKQEVCEEVQQAGFTICSVKDYREEEQCDDEAELMDLIEMVPLVRDFDRLTDRELVSELAEKYGDGQCIKTTWHYYILTAKHP
jgi:SAM-dependent methyltransferase